MNNLFLAIGRITKDIELRYTKDNKAVCDVSLAVKNGKDDTTFIKVSLWNKLAETTSKYCKKGDLIGTYGIIKNHNYEDKDGNKRYEYNFIATKVSFLATKKDDTEPKEEPKIEETEEDPFAAFGNSVEIDDNFLE